MAISQTLYSSRTDLWETPQELFDSLNQEFHFDLDVCAIPENAKCAEFYTPQQDGLVKPWIGTCWCNPPYGRDVGKWVEEAARTAYEGGLVVMLLPARTDTKWFHKWIYNRAEIRFIQGRLKFGNSVNSAPFPAMICIFGSKGKVAQYEDH